jgi:hypothetical protein
MELKQEEDIRRYVEDRLKQQGIPAEREVVCGNGIRADLVTPDTVIEIKKQLNRGAIYQAHGQGVTYQKLLNKPKLLIIGLAPTSQANYEAAQRIAENIRTNSVNVIFLDKDPQWGLTTETIKSQPKVQLPFEQSAEAPAKTTAKTMGAKQSAANSADTGSVRPKHLPSVKDIWILLLIILLFLWIKAIGWREASPQGTPLQPQPQTMNGS